MAWLRGAFVLGSSRSKASRRAKGSKTSGPRTRAPSSRQVLQRPEASSSSDDPSPLDSASQRRPSRDSECSISGISMFSSRAPSIVVSDVSASTNSTGTASPFESSSEPSTGITTPSVKGEGKVEGRTRPQLRRLPTLVSQQQTEPPVPEPTPGSSQEGCTHPEMTITKGENLACMACGDRGLKSVFVCNDKAGTPKRRRVQQSSDQTTGDGLGEIYSTPKQAESDTSSQSDLPFLKNMTAREISTFSTEALMQMIIEQNPEYAESRCQLHSAITAVRNAVSQRTLRVKARHTRESTDSPRSSISSALPWLQTTKERQCRYSVCAGCARNFADRVYIGLEPVTTNENISATPTLSPEVCEPCRGASFTVRQPRSLSKNNKAGIQWSEGGPMVSLLDLDIFYHGLVGDGWRIPKWTRPRNMLRVPQRLRREASEDSA